MSKPRVDWMDPKNQTEGGMLKGMTCELQSCKFIVTDQAFRDQYFKGKGGDFGDGIAFFVEFKPIDGGDPIWKSYSVGKADTWEVVENGDYISKITEGGLHKNCTYFKWQEALHAAGYSPAQMLKGAFAMNGMVVTLDEIETSGTWKDKQGKTHPQTLPVVGKIVKLPSSGEAKATKVKEAAADVEETAKSVLLQIVADGEIVRNKMLTYMKANLSKLGITEAEATAMFTKYFVKDAWLKAVEGVKYDGGKLSLG